MPDAGIKGADEFRALARRLERAAGRGGLRASVQRGIESSAPTLVRAARGGAEDRLPRRGGLNRRVAQTRISTKVRVGRDPGIRLIAEPNVVEDPASINRGRAAHPTFGHDPIVFQNIRSGWFTDPIEANAGVVRARVAREIRSGLRRV